MAAAKSIYWLNLDDDPAFVSGAFQQLRQFLHQRKIAVPMDPLPPEHCQVLMPLFEAGRNNAAAEYLLSLADRHARIALSVSCSAEHPIACAARGAYPLARWGLCTAGVLAVTYHPGNRFILWHETMHLLGASDHYDNRTLATTCGEPGCLMQYAPSDETVTEETCLCPETLRVLRRNWSA